jgi:hypothetical protein
MFETVYKVRVVYKGGHVQDFECMDFTILRDEMRWEAASADGVKPLKIGVDDVAAVWQIGTRKRLKFFRG